MLWKYPNVYILMETFTLFFNRKQVQTVPEFEIIPVCKGKKTLGRACRAITEIFLIKNGLNPGVTYFLSRPDVLWTPFTRTIKFHRSMKAFCQAQNYLFSIALLFFIPWFTETNRIFWRWKEIIDCIFLAGHLNRLHHSASAPAFSSLTASSSNAVERCRSMNKGLLAKVEILGSTLPPITLDKLIHDLGGPDRVAEVRSLSSFRCWFLVKTLGGWMLVVLRGLLLEAWLALTID